VYEYVKRLGVKKKMESREDGWRIVSGGGGGKGMMFCGFGLERKRRELGE